MVIQWWNSMVDKADVKDFLDVSSFAREDMEMIELQAGLWCDDLPEDGPDLEGAASSAVEAIEEVEKILKKIRDSTP